LWLFVKQQVGIEACAELDKKGGRLPILEMAFNQPDGFI
jgi:hypothetical protein